MANCQTCQVSEQSIQVIDDSRFCEVPTARTSTRRWGRECLTLRSYGWGGTTECTWDHRCCLWSWLVIGNLTHLCKWCVFCAISTLLTKERPDPMLVGVSHPSDWSRSSTGGSSCRRMSWFEEWWWSSFIKCEDILESLFILINHYNLKFNYSL